MGLSRYKFGELLELTNEKNSAGRYGENDAIGVNIDKVIQPMRGKISEKDFTKFHLVPPRHFAYNPRGSRKLGIGFNNTDKTYIITFNDNVFRIKDSAKDLLLDTYLFMYLCRSEWDRYAEFISWGSSTEVFDWINFCDEEIQLPPLPIQQKYVAVYNAMLANQQSYERGIEDLKLTCDAYIDQLRSKYPMKKLGTLIALREEKNEELQYGIDDVKGISIEKKFIDTKANMEGVSLRPYAIIKPDDFTYVTVTSRNGGKISLAHNNTQDTYICSSSYIVFTVTATNTLTPSYLAMLFRRGEFDRYARFHSWGSARETFDWDEMCDVKIPIPPIEIQQDIVNIYEAYLTRKEINEKLKTQIKNLCPILIKGSIEEACK